MVGDATWHFDVNPGLRRLLASAAATSLAERALFVALSVYAYRVGGAALIGVLAVVQAAPAVVAAPAATALLSDRVSRHRLLLVCNLTRCVLLTLIALAIAMRAGVGWVIVLAAAHSVVSTLNQPARAALIPVLSRHPRDVSSANALLASVNNASFLLGAGGGGLLVAVTDPQTVLAACALSYLVAVAIIAAIPADPPRRLRQPTSRTARGDAAAAVRVLGGSAELRAVFVVVAALSVADGVIAVLVYIAALELLGMGTSGVGFLNLACGVGGLATGAVALALRPRVSSTTVVLFGSLLLGVPMALVALTAAPAVAIVAWGCVGLGYSLVKSTSLTLVQRLTPDRSLLRVLGILESVFVGCIGLGSILAPLLIEIIGVRGTIAAGGLLLPLVAACQIRALPRSEDVASVPARQFELLRADPIFAPLPLATIEFLARRMTAVDAAPGVTIIDQGELGDRWYIIDEGDVAVTADGVPRARLGPGEAFGEIALLRDVPRTALVRAYAPSKLFALDRDTFLTAVGGGTDSLDAALAVASERAPKPTS